ncbi:putative ADPribosylglycohydrolase superfamily protein [Paratrimastix pyriformis]|uniref:ADPribosylglycohydrolase superfamily protein n=1 Tax=Paratrimastix pyriformis TaxID=342808 RepID=A0ABQ8UP89_9EUKA|nr:putative ADPribosylglycohydrolase superfamily protein [Paratrimastix pyriformis]
MSSQLLQHSVLSPTIPEDESALEHNTNQRHTMWWSHKTPAVKHEQRTPPADTFAPLDFVVPAGASTLDKATLVDKIRGAIIGNGIGDAIGVITEFSNKDSVIREFGKDHDFTFADPSRFPRGDWTDDTDQMVAILDMLIENGHVSPYDFAERLEFWIQNGFPDLGDTCGMGLGGTVAQSVFNSGFHEDPWGSAEDTWLSRNKQAAANGAGQSTATPEETRALADRALRLAEAKLDPQYLEEFRRYCTAQRVEDLQLDEYRAIGYTMKCIGSGFYALTCGKDFRTVINEITQEAGDADTNGAVAGAMLGCKVGYSHLPQDWVRGLAWHDWLMQKIDRLLVKMGLLDAPAAPPAPAAPYPERSFAARKARRAAAAAAAPAHPAPAPAPIEVTERQDPLLGEPPVEGG